MTPELGDVLELIRAARRSPHARLVLHDALLERYGDSYEAFLRRAAVCARQSGRPCAVMVWDKGLADAEERWAENGSPGPVAAFYLDNLNAFRVYDLYDLGLNRNRSLTETLVTVVRPWRYLTPLRRRPPGFPEGPRRPRS